MSTIIEIDEVNKVFATGEHAVKNLSLNIKEGEIIALLGPNGAGKTTTFYIIVGLVKPDTGSIILDKLDVSNLPIYLRGKLGISYLPQEASIFRGMNVEDNLLSIIEIKEKDKNKQNILLQNLLNEFDINNDLSVRVKPSLEKINTSNLVGVSLYFSF